MAMKRSEKRLALVGLASLLTVALATAAYVFQPWKLFTNNIVDEALPQSQQVSSAEISEVQDEVPEEDSSLMVDERSEPAEPAIEFPITLAAGEFISHEHATTGEVLIIEQEDGSRILRIEGLDTSNGPDLHVWLTDAPVLEGVPGWRVFDDGLFIDLGELKGNQGNQNYLIPADVDIDDYSSVSIWCVRFAVSFGAADLI